MLDSAKELFLERGFDAVSLAEVVRRSGGSLSTLYELFENKLGLLRAVVASERFDGIGRIEAIIARRDDPVTTLQAIAGALHDELLQPGTIGLMRVVMGESLRNPEFARGVYVVTHVPFIDCLSRLFASWARDDKAMMPEPRHAAELFLGLILHGTQFSAMFGGPCALPTADRESRIREATRLFLTGYGIHP
ncbi:MAG: TetR family transcriptional regulator [Sphingomonas bacterium]|nr:TetR family transcriptional regulator [Sphingomonas bacterium]MDB5718007.1 TetR family transcriptional regulator [Sphingomonas bacterium]